MAGILTVSVACSSVQPADHYQFMAPSDEQSAIYMLDDDGDGAATLLQQLVDDASASGYSVSDVSANSGNDGNGSGITLSRSADGNLFPQAPDSSLQGVVAARPAGAPSGAAEPVKQQFFTSGSGGSAAEAEARIVSAMSALANVAAVSSGGLPAPKTMYVAPTATPARPVMAAPAAPPVPTATSVRHEPTATPVAAVPTATPVRHEPTATPVVTVPTATSVRHEPTATPVVTVPTATSVRHEPTATPVVTVPTTTPVVTVPTATPVVVVPTASPNSSAPTAATATTENGFSRGSGENNGGSANQGKSGGNRGSEPATEPTPELTLVVTPEPTREATPSPTPEPTAEPETPTLDSTVQRLIAAYEAGDISIEKLLKELAKIYS
ncbi:MAG: hypothetical protein O3B04_09165 [Chloroflexi bacterium]|nr:hypothetical protein [Chloroflexota bacterium]